MAARMPIIAMTIINSTKVKPFVLFIFTACSDFNLKIID